MQTSQNPVSGWSPSGRRFGSWAPSVWILGQLAIVILLVWGLVPVRYTLVRGTGIHGPNPERGF